MFDRNMGAALDRHITGNYGEDQFRGLDDTVEALGVIVSEAVAHREYDPYAPGWDEVVEEIVNALVAAGVTYVRPEVEAGEPEGDEPDFLNPDFPRMVEAAEKAAARTKVDRVTIRYTDGSEAQMEFSSVHEPLEQSGTSYFDWPHFGGGLVYSAEREARQAIEDAISEAVTNLGLWPE